MSGKTTEQMLAAPQGAIYIWVAGSPLEYPIRLAKRLNRPDLKIKLPYEIEYGHCLRGFNGPIVVDHACRDLSRKVTETLDIHHSKYGNVSW